MDFREETPRCCYRVMISTAGAGVLCSCKWPSTEDNCPPALSPNPRRALCLRTLTIPRSSSTSAAVRNMKNPWKAAKKNADKLIKRVSGLTKYASKACQVSADSFVMRCPLLTQRMNQNCRRGKLKCDDVRPCTRSFLSHLSSLPPPASSALHPPPSVLVLHSLSSLFTLPTSLFPSCPFSSVLPCSRCLQRQQLPSIGLTITTQRRIMLANRCARCHKDTQSPSWGGHLA